MGVAARATRPVRVEAEAVARVGQFGPVHGRSRTETTERRARSSTHPAQERTSRLSQGDLSRLDALRGDADRSSCVRGLVRAAAEAANVSVPPTPEELHLERLRALSTG